MPVLEILISTVDSKSTGEYLPSQWRREQLYQVFRGPLREKVQV